jgi:hypothetical protein
MTVLGVGVALLAVGIILALATAEDAIGWLMSVAGVIIIVLAVLLPYISRRRQP